MFECLVGREKLFSEVKKLIQRKNHSINKKEITKVARNVLGDIGVSKAMI